MKKSDKVLLIGCVTVLALFTVAFMDLKHRAVNGIYEPIIEENPLFMVLNTLDRPVYVSVNGVENIQIMASDSFSVGYIRDRDTARDARIKPILKRIGDTLYITAGDTIHPTKGESYVDRLGMLMIYGPKTATVAVTDGQIRAHGLKDSGDLQLNAILRSGHIVFGDQNREPDSASIPEYFSRVSITCINSSVDLTRDAHIQELYMKLDSVSMSDISKGKVKKISFESAPQADIRVSGEQIKRITPNP